MIQFETFRAIGTFEISSLKSGEPSCFNGFVRYKKYKVTIEQIEEPIKVYEERLQKMWDESDNHHDYRPLSEAAKSIGYKFTNERGGKRKKRNQP